MNFLRNRSLKQWGAYLVVLMGLVYLIQYAVIQQKINHLHEAQWRIDFTRSVQLANDHLSVLINEYLNGNHPNTSDIAFSIERQDRLLRTLYTGGRIEGTDNFIEPLPKLPRITFEGLQDDWERYKNASITAMTKTGAADLPTVAPPADSLDTPSSTNAISFPGKHHAGYDKTRMQFEGLSLTLSSWYDHLVKDLEDEVKDRRDAVTHWLVFFIVLDILLCIGGYYLLNRYILKPLRTMENNIKQHRHNEESTHNEIGRVALTVNKTIENLKDATDFVTAIAEGNLNINYKDTLDSSYVPGNNKLADSLIDMQVRLQQLNEEERKRQWSNEGLSKFVDILRSSNDSLHTLGDKIISALVSYTHSNQGGLYILNDENAQQKHLELISLFAFDIKKYEQRKIRLGEGILGQTFLEKETTVLTDLPEEYIRITSGLGDAPPRSVLIVPLKVDQEVYGLVELASFREYEAYEIAFVEKLGESIASTLASVRGSQKNRHLIEQFQQQNEQMRSQEEEMRQNMEELQATQEEVARKETSYVARIKELEEQLEACLSQERLNQEHHKKLQEEARNKEQVYLSRIQELEKKFSTTPPLSGDWKVVEDLERTMRINLEALRITEETLNRKG